MITTRNQKTCTSTIHKGYIFLQNHCHLFLLILSYPTSFFQFVLKVISSDEEGGKEEKRIYNGLLEGTVEKRNKGKKGEVDIIKKR